MYQKDAQASLQFVGEDNLKKTPQGQEAILRPGKSFDVTLKRKQTDYELQGKNHFEAAYEIEIHNAGKKNENVRIIEAFHGEWTLEETSHKPMNKENNRQIWEINVPANDTVTLSYRVDVRTR